LVQQTLWLSTTFGTTPFVVSLLMLSIGSNLPELVVAAQAVIRRKSEVAYGSYLGSGVANAFFFGLLTIMHQQTIIVRDGLSLLFPAIFLLIILFFFFLRSLKGLSRVEGFTLLLIYITYIIAEWAVAH
jgi:cation:H+ antiporter